MSDQPAGPDDAGPFQIDLNVARVARLENFLAGGDAHFSVDRATAEALGEAAASGLDGLRAVVKVLKAFVVRTVRVLAADAGARQFLHIGMATPTTGMTHHAAWQIAPDARIVYASNDPTTLAHVHALDRDVPAEGAIAHVHAPYDDPRTILREAATTLDFGQPVVVILPTTLSMVPDEDRACQIVAELRDAMMPGSHLVLAQASLELASERTAKLMARLDQDLDEPYVTRSRAEIERILDGFDLLSPGLVPLERWRSDHQPLILGDRVVPIYGAVGRRP
jgi:hypothetical protein